ncbi:hypothetical protein FBU59_002304 [Linderina macrospora]|uniref:Uncharacterized protein n=1 Tax=Linderina macrospora TaxID=4868 RepID=A0ACC1JBI3_9FUNG|nr:hypothetical protein FBU59_002304 [Linderina macrospora]
MFKKFWNEVGKRVWVNEYKDSMMPRTTFRSPAPVSQPAYKKPVTAASDLSKNTYFKRDTRRNYPRTEVYTQQDVGHLLLGASQIAKLPEVAPAAEGAEETGVPSVEVKDVAEALAKLQEPVFSAEKLPPVPGAGYKFKLSPEQVVEGPGEYYPVYRVF